MLRMQRRRPTSPRIALLSLGLLMALGGSAQATTIDTASAWAGTQGACCLGDGSILAASEFVQTFTLQPGDDRFLDSFVFFLQRYDGTDPLDYSVAVYLWGGGGTSGLIGGPLFSTGTRVSARVASPNWERVEIDMGGLELTIGQEYAIEVASVVDAVAGTERVGTVGTNPYPNGDAWFQSSPGYWRSDLISGDFAMEITTTVPEPGTALLLACGLAGLAAAGRRRSLH